MEGTQGDGVQPSIGHHKHTFVYDSDIIKEFLLKEDQFEKSNLRHDESLNILGLFFQNGEKFIRSKTIFLKIFAYEGVEIMSPRIIKLVQKAFGEYNDKHLISKEEFKKIDLNEVYFLIITRITSLIIFGKEEYPQDSEEIKLFHLNQKIFGIALAMRKNPLFLFFPKLTTMLGLAAPVKELYKVIEEQEKLLARVIEKRKKSGEPYGVNVIDRILAHNEKCEKEGNTQDIISG